jgi:minor extracellular serine protease Vpr
MFRYLCLWLVPALLGAQIIPNLYIVELADEARASKVTRRAAQDTLVRTMGSRHQVKSRVQTVGNALVVESPSEAELRGMAGVRRVTPVMQLHTSLDRALSLHQIKAAWERLPEPGRGGAGIKIGIIDTGIDAKHPAFAGEGMTAPEGFPKVSSEAFREMTNGKVIVQRSYDSLNRTTESVVDGAGHGTAVAMVAAGGRVSSPFGEMSGAAPGAWLGAYRVFGGRTGTTGSSAALLQALDDAVADGMDVVNMSLGFFPPYREGLDPMADAVRRATEMGVMVIKASGNEGPGVASVDSPSVAGVGISVGAIQNDRAFAEAVSIDGLGDVLAVSSSGTRPAEPVQGRLVDISRADPTGLACRPISGDLLRGAVALILRGECFFSEKLKNAEAAGAIAAVVYTHAQEPQPFTMEVDDARLPALMVSFEAGRFLKSRLEETPETDVRLTFFPTIAFPLRGTPLSTFSSRGPTLEGRIAPDLVAVGQFISTAAGTTEPSGSVYDASGFLVAQGTSFAAPLVTGAYAVLKQARPGLTAQQYRSLLINTAAPAALSNANEGAPQQVGAGRLDLLRAMDGPLVAQPAVLNFGAGGPQGPSPQEIAFAHTGTEGARYTVRVEAGGGVRPTVEPAEFDAAAGGSTTVRILWPGDLTTGAHFGRVIVSKTAAEGEEPQEALRIPYWYGIPSPEATNITFLPYPPFSADAGSTVDLWFLTTDAVGLAATTQEPEVRVEEGGGAVVEVRRRESLAPGLVKVTVRLGPGKETDNVFLVRCGQATVRAYIVGL